MSHATLDIPVIDVDSHWTEPPDLWTSRAPAALRDRTLRVVRTPEGAQRWVYYHDTYETVQRYMSDAWAYPSNYSPYAGFHWAAIGRQGLGCDGWVSVRLPVTEERVLELDATGRVAQVHLRRFLRGPTVDAPPVD